MAHQIEIKVPDIGDFAGVEVIEVLVKEGQRIDAEASLITVESDKASMEIPSPQGGTVVALKVAVGDKVSEGDPIALLEPAAEEGEAPSAKEEAEAGPQPEPEPDREPEPEPEPEPQQPPAPPPRAPGEKESRPPPVPHRPADRGESKPHASPGVRRFARELGVDLHLVSGSGAKGRITRGDVQGFVKRALAEGVAAAPAAGGFALPGAVQVDWSRFGAIEHEPLSRIKRISGPHLHRSWVTVPHVTQFDEADITELEAFRKAQKGTATARGLKLTPLPFVLKACAAALTAMPVFNSALDAEGSGLVRRRYVNIGFAVDTPGGLVVPVLRDVDRLGIFEIAAGLAELGDKARAGKLLPGDMQGGCFTVSSLGGIGGTAFTPIINAPEVAILGLSRAEMRPVWDGAAFQPRLMLPLSLSYDHRVVDGADGVRFTSYLRQVLGDLRELLL